MDEFDYALAFALGVSVPGADPQDVTLVRPGPFPFQCGGDRGTIAKSFSRKEERAFTTKVKEEKRSHAFDVCDV